MESNGSTWRFYLNDLWFCGIGWLTCMVIAQVLKCERKREYIGQTI